MTTLITFHHHGEIRRCDAKCYDAKGPECDCVCGGRNHGNGKQHAVENTRKMGERWLADYARDQGFEVEPDLFGCSGGEV